jgi:hypothetical protein
VATVSDADLVNTYTPTHFIGEETLGKGGGVADDFPWTVVTVPIEHSQPHRVA